MQLSKIGTGAKMVSLHTKLLIGVLFELCIIFQFGKVHTAIGCFVCSSRNGSNPNCEDPFHPGLSNNSYRDKCKVPKRNHVGEFPAHFCIKVIGKSYETNEKVVIRRCATATMDNQCGNFQFEEDLLRGCILTCDLDGCNSSKSLRSSFISLSLPVLFLMFFLTKRIPWEEIVSI